MVQPLLLNASTQSAGISEYQDTWWSLPARIINGGIDPAILTPITVTHSRLLGCIDLTRPIVLELVTTFDDRAIPIANPVSSKL